MRCRSADTQCGPAVRQVDESGKINSYPQIISINQARDGYGNAGLLTVMMLYAVAEGVAQTGGLEKARTRLGSAVAPLLVHTPTYACAGLRCKCSCLFLCAVLCVLVHSLMMLPSCAQVMMHLMGRTRSAFWANVRMGIPVMFVSAFLNNTPVVSLMTPILVRRPTRPRCRHPPTPLCCSPPRALLVAAGCANAWLHCIPTAARPSRA